MGKEESGLRKILIVEDDKVLNKTLAYNLTADGYEVASAYSFQDAVERLKKSEFDIALLDINLPDGNGLHLCDEIRGRGQHTYIMFITANDKEGDMLKGYEANGYENNGMCYPLADWTQKDILSYMKQNSLPEPVRYSLKASSGVGFNLDCMLWLEKNYPQDLQRIYKVFPMAERILWEHNNKQN